MPDPIVTLTRCSDYSRPAIAEAIEKHFDLLGGLKKYVKPGDSVLLKPNFIAPKARRHATQTDPAVILEAARLLKDFGARPFIADSPAWSTTFACVKALELDESLKKLSVPVRQLDKPKKCRVGKKKNPRRHKLRSSRSRRDYQPAQVQIASAIGSDVRH